MRSRSRWLRLSRFCGTLSFVAAASVFSCSVRAQEMQFVSRSRDSLMLGGRPYYFLGANAYYLQERAARGDSATVRELFATARSLGFTAIRTWGFFDSADSLDPAVVQFQPGRYHEFALRALDFVIACAKQYQIRLLIPLVNSWDDYGGMNQYVRWRLETGSDGILSGTGRYSPDEQISFVVGAREQRFRKALSAGFGHDEFYTDSTIRTWYRNYVTMILNRLNSHTGVLYRDEPTILGWEMANEPRSMDRSGRIVSSWIDEMSCFVRSLDPNHLIGTGEEGFDISPGAYSMGAYGSQSWLFDGTEGVSFTANSTTGCIDFAGIHLYPESWNLTNGAGNVWIRDHRRISSAIGKPLILGEFGVRRMKGSTYESWLTTVLLDGINGAMVWQLLEGGQPDGERFGFECPDESRLCSILTVSAAQFNLKTQTGNLPDPDEYILLQNYPNPFNSQTTVAYDLPEPANVNLTLYDLLGKKVAIVVEGFQSAGRRKELVNLELMGSGTYFYFLSASTTSVGQPRKFQGSGKMVLVK